MAISAGNYIIRSAIDEDYVLLPSGGSKSKGAVITSGALTEADNRCYWKASVVNTSYNRFYNILSGSGNGNIMAATVADGNPITQGSYNVSKGGWLATLSGNTMTVRGVSVNTYYLTAYANSSLYLTVPEGGGELYLSTILTDTSPQEYYFEASTYVDTKIATPSNLTGADGLDYIIRSGSVAVTPQWNSSSTNTIYEMRYRGRSYDMDGNVGDWDDWSDWSMITASKLSAGIMSGTPVYTHSVDNTTTLQSDTQIEVRLTNAKNAAAYNKTGSITHGTSVSGIIRQWKAPTLTVSAAQCSQYGLKISYSNTYTLAGNMVRIVSVMDGANELISNYILTNQDYQGDITVPWDYLTQIPAENDSLDITMQIIESNGIVSVTASATVTVTYDSQVGFSFTPVYTLTNRMTIEGKLPAYDEIECYFQTTDINGNNVWKACDEVASANASYRLFEIIPAFGSAPTIMWVVSHDSGGGTQWGYKRETLGSGYVIDSEACAWNWIDDAKVPHAFALKYRVKNIIQPSDAITLPATRFVTTSREYPIFRYGKSISRALDVEGTIVNGETATNCTKADAESLATANHTVYRQPDGKWYQTALTAVSFTREKSYYNVQISQEAETR